MSKSRKNQNNENESKRPLLNDDEYEQRRTTLENEERKVELRDLERGREQEEARERNAQKNKPEPSNDKYTLLQSEEEAEQKIKLSGARLEQVELDLATLNSIITNVSDVRETPARQTVSANRIKTRLAICTWILMLSALASLVAGTTLICTQPLNRDTCTAVSNLNYG